MYGYFNRLHIKSYEARNNAFSFAESGINYLLVKNDLDSSHTIKQLFDDAPNSQVILKRKPWGFYQVQQAKSFFKKDTVHRIALTGYRADSTLEPVLYLVDRNQPLSLAGKSQIKGKAYLSKRGLKRAYIEGQNFKGKSLLEGIKLTSKPTLPEFGKKQIAALNDLIDNQLPLVSDTVLEYIDTEYEGVFDINRSFAKPTLCVYSSAPIELYSGHIKGNVIVKSESEIIVNNQIELENIILVAPKIRFGNNFKGQVQAFATDSVILGEGAQLGYPSAIGIQNGIAKSYLSIEKGAKVIGDVYLNSELTVSDQGLISIAEQAHVIGSVICNKRLELKGKVFGSITTERFYLKTPSSVYENHILNGVVDYSKKPQELVFSGILTEWYQDHQSIVTWLE